ncbi:nucleotidyltransferase substrate binding protein [bacterium]|nr:nucleotidyltransferase substrate binding protein [bacterium]
MQFEQALGRLDSAVHQKKDEFVRDACIQRFEFTFELAWKTVKQFAKSEGVNNINSPRDAFKAGFKLGFIEDNPVWLEMIEFRNLTTHTYNIVTAEAIYDMLPKFLVSFKELCNKLNETLAR